MTICCVHFLLAYPASIKYSELEFFSLSDGIRKQDIFLLSEYDIRELH